MCSHPVDMLYFSFSLFYGRRMHTPVTDMEVSLMRVILQPLPKHRTPGLGWAERLRRNEETRRDTVAFHLGRSSQLMGRYEGNSAIVQLSGYITEQGGLYSG